MKSKFIMPGTVLPVYRVLAAALAALALGAGQQAGASRFALATVSDAHGKAVVDVGADDFVIEEGGSAREILDVRVADYPLVLVLDNGRGARADFASIRSAAARFIDRMGPRPIALVTTAPAPALVTTFEDERESLLSHLEEIEPTDADGQPLRAAALAASTIRATGALFSAIVVAAASPAEVSGTEAEEPLAPIVDSRAVVHIVANDRGVGASAAFFRGISQQTHGDYTAIYASASFQPAFDRLLARLTTELLVEYIVPVGSKPVDVKIGVRQPGSRVRGLGVAPR